MRLWPALCTEAQWQWKLAFLNARGEVCMISSPNWHFGKYRYIINTDYLRF